MYKISPISAKFINHIKKFDKIITIEENCLNGGIGSIIAEIISDNNFNTKLKRFGLNDNLLYNYGSREYLHKSHKIDSNNLLNVAIKYFKWANLEKF